MTAEIPVAILCGGRGTRLRERTAEIPKALVEIGGMPILWHVVGIYAAHGFRRFLLLTGYRGEMIEALVAGPGRWGELEVECVDTGLDTPTGGRLKLVSDRLAGGTFCATYADGLADVDLRDLARDHRTRRPLATMTVVRPHSQFGVAELDTEDHVVSFREKPRLESWVNGGFLCLEPEALERFEETSVLEDEPLRRLAAEGELNAHRHHGFWDCMDTYKDAVVLNDLWARGEAPWAPWPDSDRAPAGERRPSGVA